MKMSRTQDSSCVLLTISPLRNSGNNSFRNCLHLKKQEAPLRSEGRFLLSYYTVTRFDRVQCHIGYSCAFSFCSNQRSIVSIAWIVWTSSLQLEMNWWPRYTQPSLRYKFSAHIMRRRCVVSSRGVRDTWMLGNSCVSNLSFILLSLRFLLLSFQWFISMCGCLQFRKTDPVYPRSPHEATKALLYAAAPSCKKLSAKQRNGFWS